MRRRVGMAAFAIFVVASGSCLAEVAGSDFEIDNGFVRSWADDFTDAYRGTILLISGEDGAAFRIYHFGEDTFAIQFFDEHRELQQMPEDGAEVEVTVRIDSAEAATIITTWSAEEKHASVEGDFRLTEAPFMDALANGRRIIYRIGVDGEVLRIRIPYEMPELVAEFRRRVAASGVEQAEIPHNSAPDAGP